MPRQSFAMVGTKPASGRPRHDVAPVVYFDLVQGYPQLGGVAHYAQALGDALKRRLDARLVRVSELGLAPDRFGAAPEIFDHEARLAPVLAQRWPRAVFLFPNFHSPLPRGRFPGIRVVNIVHDVQFKACPEFFSAEDNAALDIAFRQTRERADDILFVSEATRTDFVRHFGAPRAGAVIGAPLQADPRAEAAQCAAPYLLATSHNSSHPHKNLSGLMALFERLAAAMPRLELRMTGYGADVAAREIDRLPRAVASRVHHMGLVSRAELDGLYRSALGFVSLSRFEGFNLSAGEAAVHGLPLILSDLPAHRELFGDIALFDRPDLSVDEVRRHLVTPPVPTRRLDRDFAPDAVAARAVRALGLVSDTEPRLPAVLVEHRPRPTAPARHALRRAMLSSMAVGAFVVAQAPGHLAAQTVTIITTLAHGGSGAGGSSGGLTFAGGVGGSLDQSGGDAQTGSGGGGGGGGPGSTPSSTPSGGFADTGVQNGGDGGSAGATADGSTAPTGPIFGSGGQNGTSGGVNNYFGYGAGGGGAGGYGVVVQNPANFTISTFVLGGKGGSGGDLNAGYQAGGGGDGGGGLLLVRGGSITIGSEGSLSGNTAGDGYDDNAGTRNYASAGTGGAGLETSATVDGGTFSANVINAGQISGGTGGTGVSVTSYYGTNSGTGGAGVALIGGGLIHNEAGGTISGGTGGGAGNYFGFRNALVGPAASFGSAGSPGGIGGAGADLFAGGTITNDLNATITGGAGGAGANGTFGTSAQQGGQGGSGVLLRAGVLTSSTNAGLISGGVGGAGGGNSSTQNGGGNAGGDGVTILSSGANVLTNLSTGVIQGGDGGAGGSGNSGGNGTPGYGGFGVNVAGTLTLVNNAGGLIKGGTGALGATAEASDDETLVAGTGGGGGIGVFFSNAADLNNAGTIQGGSGAKGGNGIADDNSSTAAGGFGGYGNAAVYTSGGGSIINTGSITGGSGGLAGTDAGSSIGATAGFGDVGIHFDGAGMITNGGTIAGGTSGDGATQADAIQFYSGDHTLKLITGATFVGLVEVVANEGGTGRNTVLLDGSSSGSVNLAQFIGFNELNQAGGAGGTWTLTGTGTLVSSFDNQENETPASASVSAGTLVFASGSRLNVPTFTISAGGTASFQDGNSLGGGTTQLVLNGGTLTIAGTGLHSLANPFTFTNAGGTVDVADGGNTFTIGSTLGGTGSLTKAGAGQLNLTGLNGYSGGTAVNAGTLGVGNGQALGTGTVTAAGGTTLAFLTSDTVGNPVAFTGTSGVTLATAANTPTLAGVVSGTGPLVKTGTGALTLTGANTFTGGTLLAQGTIGVGNDTALGVGLVALNDGTGLTFLGDHTLANAIQLGFTAQQRAQDPTFDTGVHTDTLSGPITGAGSLTKVGAGTLRITHANAYSGGTQLQQGTIAIADGAALGTGLLSMDENTTLRFDADGLNVGNAIAFTGITDPTIDTGANNATISGSITGPGSLTKIGTGALDLTGASTYTGGTEIQQGTLLVDGSITSAVQIDSGARLGGMGTVGGFTALSGAIVAPGFGTKYSTLSSPGSITFNPGSIFAVNVNPAGQTDAIVTGGSATINGGTVAANTALGNYSVGNVYTIVTAAAGVNGAKFDAVTTSTTFAFLTPTLTYDPTHVYLGFVQNTQVNFGSVAITPNQTAAAGGIQGLGPGNPVYNAVLPLTPAGAQQAFDAASGEAHASAATAAVRDARFVSTAIFDRLWNMGGSSGDAYQVLQNFGPTTLPTLLRCYAPGDTELPSIPSSYAVWGQAIGSFGHDGSNGNAASLDRTLGGFIFGADMPYYLAGGNVIRFGVAAGYTNDSFSVDRRASNGTYETAFGTLYGGARFGAIDLRFGAGYGGNQTTMRRTIQFGGFLDHADSNYGGETVQGFAEIGYRFALSRVVLEPIAGFTAVHVHQDGFREQGGAAALNGFGRDTDVQTTVLGFRSEASPFAGLPIVARLMLGWQHAFGDLSPTSVVQFQSGAQAFTVEGAPIDRDAAVAEAALEYRVTSAMTLGVSYAGQVGDRDYENAVKGRFEYKF